MKTISKKTKNLMLTLSVGLLLCTISCDQKSARIVRKKPSIVQNNSTKNTTTAISPKPVIIPANDPAIKYVGRWDKTNDTLYHSYWGGAYFRVNFSGKTAKIKLAGPVNISTKIDHGNYVKYHIKKSGIVNLTPTPLKDTTHSLQIAANFQRDEIQFQGLILAPGAHIAPPKKRTVLIEFIGNSITSGAKTKDKNIAAYPFAIGEMKGYDHTQISYPGIPLVDGFKYGYKGAPNVGLSLQYFWKKEPNHKNNPEWNFDQYTPQIAVINIGTNDFNLKVPTSLFQSTYRKFLKNIRAKFPKIKIVVLRTFKDVYTPQIKNAVQARIAAGDNKILYIDTKGWTVPSDFVDGTHPTGAGHLKIAKKLAPLLAKEL